MMNKAYLQALELEVELQAHQFIREVGIVPNLADHIIKTKSEFGYTLSRCVNELIKKYGSISDVRGGICTIYTEPSPPLYSKPREICVIAVKKSVAIIEWFSLGEEETHALEHFNEIKKLDEIMNQFSLTLDISKFTGSDKEGHYIQKLGGFFALLRKGYDLMNKEFTEDFMNKSREVMGYQESLHSLRVLLEIKKNIILNSSNYLKAIESR